MKDPFPPARAAGCRAMVDNIDQYEPKDIAFRVLPTICGLLVDPEKSVRDGNFSTIFQKCSTHQTSAGFQGVQKFVSILEDVHNDPEKAAALNPNKAAPNTTSSVNGAQTAVGSPQNAQSGWAGYLASSAMSMAASAASAAASTATSKFRKEGSATPTTPTDDDVPKVVVEKPSGPKEEKSGGGSGGMKLKKPAKKGQEINWDEIEAETKEASDNGWGKGVTNHKYNDTTTIPTSMIIKCLARLTLMANINSILLLHHIQSASGHHINYTNHLSTNSM